MTSYEEIQSLANGILSKVKGRPNIGIICGSGLGKLVDVVTDQEIIPYKDIPGFPISTVPGHEGKLVFGKLSGKSVVLMQGRVHCYEGYPPQKIAVPVRTMKMMGVKTLIVTNAAGGINRDFKVGDLMIIKDHVNLAGFAGVNPLVGLNDERFGPRFPAMSNCYDLKYRQLARSILKELNYQDFMREGVYSMMVGPAFETVTECKLLSILGVDATGMSTVPEVLVARHCGLKVFGMSLITNECVMEYDSEQFANHEEVLETGKKRSENVKNFFSIFIEKIEV
ncbi:purine nucleoside phosphorylase isoform X2 [Patella vulgata]|uniref:purine nucleoside phosphorylase isoform X2 n=1 Tax=Patella vulgata TaxID=6465 RepID=UPI00218096EF|nr:purine nucleoside phosphorylase isoform X2 [Patella vulgata]